MVDINSTNTKEIFKIINYFISVPWLNYHDQVAALFVNKIKEKLPNKRFTILLQKRLTRCLELIIESSTNIKKRLLWFYPIFIKLNHKHVEQFCMANILKLIHLKYKKISFPNITTRQVLAKENLTELVAYTDFNPTTRRNFKFLLSFQMKVLTAIKYDKVAVMKTLLILYNDPSILHTSLNCG